MKHMCKRLTALALALSMCLSLLCATTWAVDETGEAEAVVSASSVTTETYTYINPEYEDVITEDDLVQPSEDEGNALVSAASTIEYCTTIEEAAELMREELKNRTTTITVYYQCSASTGSLAKEISNAAFEHTGDPEEGDYLAHQYGGWTSSSSISVSGGTYYYTITYTVTYFTTAEQEAAVTAKLETVMESLDLDSKCDYKKIEAIYNYICDNVTYDYTNLNDDDYMLKYTAYAALINGTSVCQGYSVLFYRMALEAGIDARYISGTATNSSGSTGAHGWNIVKLGNVYYNVDSTWDAVYRKYNYYKYFLLCNDTFGTDHFRSSDYTTDTFNTAYPMASSDYTLTDDDDHSWGTPEFIWADGYGSATATFTCTAGDGTKTLDCTVTSAVTTAATCTATGVTTYTATVTFDGTKYTDTKTETISTTEHSY
ncbi:MAG: hypothetical protein LUD84_01590, partial [Clostridiales bacterium]|nr:hypothetical protein [Clostridiales bacterium]